MSDHKEVYVRIAPGYEGAKGEWVTDTEDLHIYDYRFDEYDTEVVSLDAFLEHRTVIQSLDWEQTHRKRNGRTWKIDFEALELVVKHLTEHDLPVTIEPSILQLFLADFEGPFLEEHVPSDPPPVDPGSKFDEQMDLSDFGSG